MPEVDTVQNQLNDTPTRPVALITGAATRIGATIAKRFAAIGIDVIIHYRHSSKDAEALSDAINRQDGRSQIIQADLTNQTERSSLIENAAKLFGPITILINNASVYIPDSVETLDEKLWDTHFALHTKAPLFLSRDFAAQLPASMSGNIVNIIDARLSRLSPDFTSYTLSKATLWTATQTMAQSLAPRIRVNAIGPGPTLPEDGQTDADFSSKTASLPLAQGANPDEIVDGIFYFLNAKSVTGQMLAVDGGSHLAWPERGNVTPRVE